MKLLSLTGTWQLRRQDQKNAAPIHCEVPGSIHSALLSSGIISNPLEDNALASCAWVGETEWVLSRSFEVDEDFLSHDLVDLECEAVDTLATILVNGKSALRTDNRYRPHRADIRHLLRKGTNRISVRFRPATGEISAPWKPRCAFGKLSYFPPIVTAGLPGDVQLRAWNRARIADWGFGQQHPSSGPVRLLIGGWLELADDAPERLQVSFSVDAPDGETIWSAEADIIPGSTSFSAVAPIRKPQRWWPAGYGEQPLYSVRALLRSAGGTLLDTRKARIGLRTLSAVTGPGGATSLLCNGYRVFLKGAVWAGAHPYHTLYRREDFEPYIASARDAHFNTLRLSASVPPEASAFWELCDEAGIIVTNTAPLGDFAAQGVPDSPDSEEPEPAPFLRHTCVPDSLIGEPDEDSGLILSRSCASYPASETLSSEIRDSLQNLTGPTLTRRTALRGGPTALLAPILARYPLPRSHEAWLSLSQIAQAEEIRSRVLAARADPNAAGFLWEPFCSLWAAADNASIDCTGRWKALQYEAARVFAPEVLSASLDLATGKPVIRYRNDSFARRTGRFQWRLTTLEGTSLAGSGSAFTAAAQSEIQLSLPEDLTPYLTHYGCDFLALWVSALDAEGFLISRDVLLFAPPKDLRLQKPAIQIDDLEELDQEGEQAYKITLSSAVPAFFVQLELPSHPALFSDGFFFLEPDDPMDIFVTPLSPISLEAFRTALVIRSLYECF